VTLSILHDNQMSRCVLLLSSLALPIAARLLSGGDGLAV